MARRHPSAARLLAVLASIVGTASAQVVGQVSLPEPAPPGLCASFDVAVATVQTVQPYQVERGDVAAELRLGGLAATLALQPFDVRAPDFQLIVRDGAGEHVEPTPPSVTYRGFVLEDPVSTVAASVVGDLLTAWIRLGDGTTWVVQPVVAVDPAAARSEHIVYRAADNVARPEHCGVTDSSPGAPPPPSGDLTLLCDLAIEADFPFYQSLGSDVTATQNDITTIVNGIAAIYTADVSVNVRITHLVVDAAPDAYTSSDPATLLGQVRATWNATRGGLTRSAAHLFTGRPLGATSGGTVGFAYLATVCNTNTAYGVSQSRYSTNASLRVGLTAHELGHGFSATHCDAAAPPCNIMCSIIGGCGGTPTTFGPGERAQISTYAQAAPCLVPRPVLPVVNSIQPTVLQMLDPRTVTVSGSGFLGASQVLVGGAPIASGFATLSDSAVRVTLPPPTQLGPVTIQVVTIFGTSNAATVTFTAASPCSLVVSPGVLGGSSLTWNFAGTPNNAWVLMASAGTTLVPFQGFPVLTPADVLAIGFFDPVLGLASHTVPVPARILSLQTNWSQLVELTLGASPVTLASVSRLHATTVVH